MNMTCMTVQNAVCVCVCRHGLKMITPEETFTVLASSPTEKVHLLMIIDKMLT